MPQNIPKYREIARQLRARVLSGELSPGDPVPARRKLKEEYNTTRATIDKVMDLLTAEGMFLPSDKNRPPRVADITQRVVTVDSRLDSHAATGRALRKNETSKILSVKEVPCPADVAVLLGVEAGAPVLCRKRLNLLTDDEGNETPDATGYSYYPPEVVEATPELKGRKSIPGGSRELAAERMGSRQAHITNVVTSRLATDEERELLNLGGTMPIVTQNLRHVTLANGKTVEVAAKIHEGSRPLSFSKEL